MPSTLTPYRALSLQQIIQWFVQRTPRINRTAHNGRFNHTVPAQLRNVRQLRPTRPLHRVLRKPCPRAHHVGAEFLR